jgi:hypothetical protein
LIASAKRLLQQNLPKANYRGAAKQRLDSITSMAPGTLVRDHWLLEPGGLSNH